MYCKNCGNSLNQNDKFCINCGANVLSGDQNIQGVELNNQVNNQSFGIEMPNNQVSNGNTNSNNKFEKLAVILGILSILFLFITAYAGIILGIAAILISIKVQNNYSKKGKLLGIIGIILCFLYIVGTTFINKYMNDEELNGKWFCIDPINLSKITSDNTSSIWSEAIFDNGQYTLKLGESKVNGNFVGGTTRSGKYKMKPSTLNENAWESVKGSLTKVWDLSDKLPKTFMLSTDEGSITALKVYTITGEILMLYTGNDSYICWLVGSNDDPTSGSNNNVNIDKNNNSTNNNSGNSSKKVKGQYSREIFGGNKFEYKTYYDTATFTFNSDSTFVVTYASGETYKGNFEVYNGLYISIKADEIAADSSIENASSIANDIKNVSDKMMSTTVAMLNTYLLWVKTDTGIIQPFVINYEPSTESGIAVNILGQIQGSFIKK